MFRFLPVSLLALTIQQANAGEVITDFSPSEHPGKSRSFEKMPEVLPIEEETLKLSGPLDFSRLQQLKDERYKHIIINGSYLDTDPDRVLPLIISPELFHSSLKSLTLSACTLDDESFVGISKFNKLDRLSLESNYITDESIPYIVSTPNLKYLSLASTHISDESVPRLLAMPSLQELDISLNKDITDKSFDIISQDKRLKMVNVRCTKMSIGNRGEIRKKYAGS